jgi:hypothetical protein
MNSATSAANRAASNSAAPNGVRGRAVNEATRPRRGMSGRDEAGWDWAGVADVVVGARRGGSGSAGPAPRPGTRAPFTALVRGMSEASNHRSDSSEEPENAAGRKGRAARGKAATTATGKRKNDGSSDGGKTATNKKAKSARATTDDGEMNCNVF